MPGRAGAQVDRGHGRLLVGEQLHPRRPGRDPGDEADEAVRGDDRVVDPDAVLRARRDDDRLRERAGRPADHLGRDRVEVGGEARTVDVVEQRRRYAFSWSANSLWIARWRRSRLGAERSASERAVEQAVGPAVGVTERLRDALEAHRERAEDGRAGRLDAAQRAVVAGAERERDEDERERARGSPRRGGGEAGPRCESGAGRRDAPDCQAQRRRSRAALPGHGEPV